MLRVCLLPVLSVLLIRTTGLVVPAQVQDGDVPGRLGEMSLPVDLGTALLAIGDRGQPDRSQFLLEIIRRAESGPSGLAARDRTLEPLLARLDSSRPQEPVTRETLPLPLPAQIWIDVVFAGRATPETLVAEILRSRNASLFYCGLLALDDATRAWLATEPALLAELASRHAAAFLVAAPAVRVGGGVLVAPGGHLSAPAWETLVGKGTHQPADFIRALVGQGEGRLAYFFGAMGQLTPAEAAFAMNLGSPEPAARLAAVRRLYGVFERVAGEWQVDRRPFWRPALDPALLVADLEVDAGGRPLLPGTRSFWSAVFADGDEPPASDGALAGGDPLEFAWLCETVFRDAPIFQRRAYAVVLFASRMVDSVTPQNAEAAVVAVRAARTYPALAATLERAGLRDLGAIAGAVRRANRLAAVGDHVRAARAVAQFQGALALVSRAASRGTVSAAALPGVVLSLASVDTGTRGEYDGRLVRWFAAFVDAHPDAGKSPASTAANDRDPVDDLYLSAVGSLDRDTLRLMAAGPAADRPEVEWEGTRYRLDFSWAEARRLARVLGDDPMPYLSSARALAGIAETLGGPGLTDDMVRAQLTLLDGVKQSGRWEDDVVDPLQRAGRTTGRRDAARLAPALRALADELLARGLVTLAYAAALGQPERMMISAGEAASRHDFGLRIDGAGRAGAWWLAAAGAGPARDWRVTGSVLGLEVALADFSLLRLSHRPPARRPTLNDEDRQAFIETVAIVQPSALIDAHRDVIVGALRQGRARLAAVRTVHEAGALADEIRLSPARRGLLRWLVAHEPGRVGSFLSLSELLWLGIGPRPVDASLHAWGAPGRGRAGCLCLRMDGRRPWEVLAGRWGSGLVATGFPDLNLRLAELLSELRMPAPLLGPVLASATLDFVNTVESRDRDDRRGLTEFVHALGVERVEQYLALLTTGGPLVPVDEMAATDPGSGVRAAKGERR